MGVSNHDPVEISRASRLLDWFPIRFLSLISLPLGFGETQFLVSSFPYIPVCTILQYAAWACFTYQVSSTHPLGFSPGVVVPAKGCHLGIPCLLEPCFCSPFRAGGPLPTPAFSSRYLPHGFFLPLDPRNNAEGARGSTSRALDAGSPPRRRSEAQFALSSYWTVECTYIRIAHFPGPELLHLVFWEGVDYATNWKDVLLWGKGLYSFSTCFSESFSLPVWPVRSLFCFHWIPRGLDRSHLSLEVQRYRTSTFTTYPFCHPFFFSRLRYQGQWVVALESNSPGRRRGRENKGKAENRKPRGKTERRGSISLGFYFIICRRVLTGGTPCPSKNESPFSLDLITVAGSPVGVFLLHCALAREVVHSCSSPTFATPPLFLSLLLNPPSSRL